MTKPATQNYVAYGGASAGSGLAILLASLLIGCSSSDYGTSSADPALAASSRAEPGVASPVAAATANGRDSIRSGASATGADGYPNINVDTADPTRAPARSAQERDQLEADLMALGARQRSSADVTKPQSVVQELQELGRRSKAEAERQIESGAPPAKP